jgi:hypothetical protein
VRKTRLRSVWLAMVLLALACGTAFAQLDLVIEPECIECCPLEGLGPCPGYAALVTSRGWESGERMNLILTGPGPSGPFGTFGFVAADESGEFDLELIFLCQNPWVAGDEASSQFAEYYWWIHPDWSPADYGEWRLDLRGESGSVVGHFLFAEDCVAAEFVPEPGSLLLLGSGMTGLIAYLTHRRHWRRA